MAVPTVPELIAKLSPLPIAQGTVQPFRTGWIKAYYYDPLTGLQVTFKQPPTVVASALSRSGVPPSVSAPVISIPSIDLPAAPTITIPTVDLPSFPTVPSVALPPAAPITISKPSLAFLNESFPYFVAAPGIGHDVVQALCDQLNQMTNTLYDLQGGVSPSPHGINGAILLINEGLTAAYNTCQAIINEINALVNNTQAAVNTYGTNINATLSDLRNKMQAALNAYQTNIQNAINAALSDTRDKMQAALNAYQASIQNSINQGLSSIIPDLYDQIGVPLTELITPVQVRNVAADSFEFYCLSEDYAIHYVAVGTKL